MDNFLAENWIKVQKELDIDTLEEASKVCKEDIEKGLKK